MRNRTRRRQQKVCNTPPPPPFLYMMVSQANTKPETFPATLTCGCMTQYYYCSSPQTHSCHDVPFPITWAARTATITTVLMLSLPAIVLLKTSRADAFSECSTNNESGAPKAKRRGCRRLNQGRTKRSRETLHFSFISEDKTDRKAVLPSRVFTHRSSPPSYSKRMGPLRTNGKKRGQHPAKKWGKQSYRTYQPKP